ncbi:MAG: type III pantothenate kinase [Proteobacteria bacterium]|nr:type III pantothenate kinase [Pseudomonadota bacterium]
MIFVIDIGNTNIVLGVYKGPKLLHLWRVSTDIKKTSDEYLITVKNLFRINDIDPTEVKSTILGSVVSPLDSVFQAVVRSLTNHEARLVDLSCFPDMPVKMDNPSEVGADRLLNASAGYEAYGGPLVIIDFGTATTFDVISAKGEYLGGVIATGLVLSLEALTAKAFKLPKIDLVRPSSVIGKNTAHCMQSGIVFGYAGLVDSMVQKITEELGAKPKVIATGGLATLIQPVSNTIEDVVDDLTLKGLYRISQTSH